MFRHYRVILRERIINTLPSYTSISNAAVVLPTAVFTLEWEMFQTTFAEKITPNILYSKTFFRKPFHL
jgi:hypothetical protein